MTQPDPRFPTPRRRPAGLAEKFAAALAVLWLGLGGLALWYAPGTMSAVEVVLPALLLALAWWQARRLRLALREVETLRLTLATLSTERRRLAERTAKAAATPAASPPEPPPLFRAARRLPAEAGAEPVPAPAEAVQASLPFGNDAPPKPLATGDFLQALNFPQDPDDTDGFRALRLALKHPQTAPLIQAAEDVLTLMSQIGLYMDDLDPDHPRPELWRRFAAGERGGALGALAGVRDAAALEKCGRAMRENPVFRDAAHHFLRRFDMMLVARQDSLDDTALVRLAETRTGRAFMLLGRVAGIFD